MRKILISAALISAAAVAAPASAQYYPNHNQYGYGYNQNYNQHYDRNVSQQLNQIRQRIQQSAQRGRISRGEANRLFRQANQIERLQYRYARNGLTRWEMRDLQNRVQNLRRQLRHERRDGRYDDRRYDDRRYNDRW